MHAVFVMLKVDPGHLYEVADAIAETEEFSEMYSIIGDHDLLVKIYVDSFEALGGIVTDKIHKIPHIRETKTIPTFRTYKLGPSGKS